MSEKNQIVVVLIVPLFLGAFVDRATALKIVVGVALLWSLQNHSAIIAASESCSRTCEEDFWFGSTAETCARTAGLRRIVLSLARSARLERPILAKH